MVYNFQTLSAAVKSAEKFKSGRQVVAGCCHASLWSGGTGGHSVVVIETLTSRSLNILLNPGQLQNYLYNS